MYIFLLYHCTLTSSFHPTTCFNLEHWTSLHTDLPLLLYVHVHLVSDCTYTYGSGPLEQMAIAELQLKNNIPKLDDIGHRGFWSGGSMIWQAIYSCITAAGTATNQNHHPQSRSIFMGKSSLIMRWGGNWGRIKDKGIHTLVSNHASPKNTMPHVLHCFQNLTFMSTQSISWNVLLLLSLSVELLFAP